MSKLLDSIQEYVTGNKKALACQPLVSVEQSLKSPLNLPINDRVEYEIIAKFGAYTACDVRDLSRSKQNIISQLKREIYGDALVLVQRLEMEIYDQCYPNGNTRDIISALYKEMS